MKIVSTALLIAVTGIFCLANTQSNVSEGSAGRAFKLIAGVPINAGHKLYHIELSPSRNWADAKVACESQGFELASMVSKEESMALEDPNYANVVGTFWTSARDTHDQSQLKWNEGDSTEDNEHLAWMAPDPAFQPLTCGAYVKSAGQPGTMHLKPCSHTYAVMCHEITP